MTTITTRSGKGSPLTNNEVDANFTNLNTDKAELSGATFTGAVTISSNLSVDGGTIKLDGNYPVGTDNVALGNTALDSLVSGNYSTAIGANALTANTASSNTALGFAALEANTSGTQNTAVGMQALTDNTTANNNVAVGHRALFANTTGTANVALGSTALTEGFELRWPVKIPNATSQIHRQSGFGIPQKRRAPRS